MDILNDSNIVLMSKLLDLTAAKNKVIANNIANVNTPGYNKLEVNFEEELQKAVRNGADIEKIHNIEGKISMSNVPAKGNNGNNVDMDKEMIEFFKTSDKHNIVLELVSKNFNSLINAIQGR